MNVRIFSGILFWCILVLYSCNRDDISFDAPSQELRFSADTVFCDTVYNQVRSETYAVKVYNNEDKDVMIPTIKLSRGASSLYRINVDGTSGFEFSNVPLRKKDSLYIFVEIAPTANVPEFIAEDQVIFETPVAKQHVTLFSVVQDAEFFVQTSSNTNILSGNVNWNNNKAKIIYGDLTLAHASTLTIQSGTKVYFHKNSGMKISGGATLNVNGDLGSEVVFRGDRNDPRYDTIPKNWNSILLEPSSELNMNYAKVFGGVRGLEMSHNTATIKNSIIHTFDEYGIYAINSTINAENLVMNNCQNAAINILKGGTYNFTHCTLVNYWKLTSSAPKSIMATNKWTNLNGQQELGALNLTIKNSIVYGLSGSALLFEPIGGQTFSYLIMNSLLKYESTAGFDFDGNPSVVNSYKNEDPKFLNYYTEKLNLRVAADSPAKNKGNASVASTVPFDLVKISRTLSPTLGAYQ